MDLIDHPFTLFAAGYAAGFWTVIMFYAYITRNREYNKGWPSE